MSYHCIKPDCPNHDANLPKEAAQKLEYRCFLCESELVPPPVPLEKIVDFVEDLPAAIQIMPKLQVLLSDANSSISDIIGLIKTDPSLVSRIVKASNTAYFAGSYYCSTIEDAMNRIGFTEAYNIIGYVAASQLFQQDLPLYGLTSDELWSSSVRGASSMQLIGSRLRLVQPYVLPNSGVAYTVGLLRSVGKMLINFFHGTHGIAALSSLKAPLTVEMEKSLLGFDNREAAAALLRKWNFQEEVVSPILFQDTPFECEEVRPLACLLNVTAKGIRDFPPDKLVDEPQALRSSFKSDGGLLSAINLSPKALLDGLAESTIDFQAFSKSLLV
ncbi:MAG: HDOD domain-containing protein [Opitutae bacterium]|nr:HDOD domain-containing protein [Opitutae bacterium]MBT7924723.1 HDOD domain-containing protein [Opitutae bacterium]